MIPRPIYNIICKYLHKPLDSYETQLLEKTVDIHYMLEETHFNRGGWMIMALDAEWRIDKVNIHPIPIYNISIEDEDTGFYYIF